MDERRRRNIEIVAVVAVVILAAFYARAGYIPTWSERHLAEAAEKWDLPVANVGPWFSAWTLGDGQATAIIASDPLGYEFGEVLRDPGYRFARAGYSWLTWAVIGGQHHLIPYGMAIVGGLALVGVLITALVLQNRLGTQAWLLLLNPALYIGFAGDTAEPLAILFLTLAMASNSHWAGVALGVTRPDYLIAAFGRWRVLAAGLTASVVMAAYGIWRFGFDTLLPKVDLLALPFAGYLDQPSLAGWLLATAALGTLVVGIRNRDVVWVLAALFVVCFAPIVTVEPVNAWRAAGMLPVLWAFGPRPEQAQRSAASDMSPLAASA
ncbi:MAG: hypothetical protein ACRDWS_14265 [Acidimicrobiia bacterium]